MKKFIPLLFTLLLFQFSYSQQIEDTPLEWKKNSFSAGFGICGLCGSVTTTYERLFEPKTLKYEKQGQPKSFKAQWLFRLESGYYGNVDIASSLLINPQIGYLRSLRKERNNVEMGAGLAVFAFVPSYGGPPTQFRPSAYLGIRRQKPDKRRFFRIGASYPQGGYLSFGLYTKSR